MERVERVYEKGPGFLRDVFQYLLPGILFLSLVLLVWFFIDGESFEINFLCLFCHNSWTNSLFILFLVIVIFGYFMGALFMELGDLLNWFVKGKLNRRTFGDEMKIANSSPIILSFYIERYNLLFFTKRNIAVSFFSLAICSLIVYLFLLSKADLIYVTIFAVVLGSCFSYFARKTYRDFIDRLGEALKLIEKEEKK